MQGSREKSASGFCAQCTTKRRAAIINDQGAVVKVMEWDDPAAVFVENFNRESPSFGTLRAILLGDSDTPAGDAQAAGVTDAR